MPFPTIANTERSRRIVFAVTVAGLLLLAILLAVGGTRGPDRAIRSPMAVGHVAKPATGAPPVPRPVVEPLELIAMTPDRARLVNSMVPFVGGRLVPAAPFRFAGDAEDRTAAGACLASAAWYEAGDDPVGERAVVQVVLNRVRHPAYPKTVCGVVFQGSERRTGCQFSFTCDGAMARRPSATAWIRAEGIADAALSGAVDRSVGNATHYHTDWVVPYWSTSLDKLSRVGTHLFFRWRGYWGQPAAFRGVRTGTEVVDPRVPGAAGLTTAAAVAVVDGVMNFTVPEPPGDETIFLGEAPVVTLPGVSTASLQGHVVRAGTADGTDYALELDATASADGYPAAAQAVCRDRPVCTVAGWSDPDRVPTVVPIQLPQLRTATFVYRRRGAGTVGQSLWNCRQHPRTDKTQCLPGTE